MIGSSPALTIQRCGGQLVESDAKRRIAFLHR